MDTPLVGVGAAVALGFLAVLMVLLKSSHLADKSQLEMCKPSLPFLAP